MMAMLPIVFLTRAVFAWVVVLLTFALLAKAWLIICFLKRLEKASVVAKQDG
ncbi:hypothetical protein [Thiobaca trueperi]|uniref:hypothetical protein n=1 Tax=Thiobaca trueperi TaxID=127458 RepID=UPI001404981E|nr:hypothetical protein [Thiobaca trueperi]